METEQLVQLDHPEPQGHPDLLELQVLQEHLDQVDPQELLAQVDLQEHLALLDLREHLAQVDLREPPEQQEQQDHPERQEHPVLTETDIKQHLLTTLLWDLPVELPEELVYLIP